MLYFRTTNPNKFREAEAILSSYNVQVARLPEAYKEVQADTLEEVAQEALQGLKPGTFIEDAGLFIDALKGFPGVYSSYAQRTIGNKGILRLLEGMEDRGAAFESVVGLVTEGGQKIFKGRVRGSISQEAKGEGGFGYDPIFTPAGHNKTFAEDARLKNEISHRKLALERLADYLGGR